MASAESVPSAAILARGRQRYLAATARPSPAQRHATTARDMRLDCGRALLEMVLPQHQELSFQEVSQMVEKISSNLRLQMDGNGKEGKGRYLVARCALKAGEVIVSERPIFEGNTDAQKSEKIYSEAFLEKLQATPDMEDDVDDCFHPRSPLMDCVAAVLLSKQLVDEKSASADIREKAVLNLQKFCSLCRSPVQSTTDYNECVEDLWGALKPELQEITSREELGHVLQILSCNRFGHGGQSVQLMFAGSMFEHSCLPNCFLGTACTASPNADGPQTYRALRDIEEGEVLSIDYLNFPLGYCSMTARAEAFQKWGFTCSCPRCVELPEVERSFNCAECGEPDLCPCRPGSSVLQCLSCKKVADASYAARCLEREAQLQREPASPARKVGEESDDENLLGHRHHLVVHALWEDVEAGLPDSKELPAFQQMLEVLIESVSSASRLEEHPALLNLYHLAALSTQDDLETQKHYLQLEHRIMQRFFPEEAQRQDDEIMSLVKPTKEPTQLETVTAAGTVLAALAVRYGERSLVAAAHGSPACVALKDLKEVRNTLGTRRKPAGPPELIHGDEVIEPVDAAVEAAIQKLKERADKHAEEHVAQAGAQGLTAWEQHLTCSAGVANFRQNVLEVRWTNLNTLTTDPMHPMHRMHSLVVGASRGLGLALTRHLAEVAHRAGGSGGSQGRVLAAARRPVPALEEVRRSFPDIVEILELDVTAAEAADAADCICSATLLGCCSMAATGPTSLEQDKDRGVIPENHLQKVEANALAYSFAVNAIGPLLVLKHFSPLLKAGATDQRTEDSDVPGARAVFYSARVGSIGDNATGGWYSYRSSKAALNQMVRCASIELRRHSVCCFALHPGTVDTDLTRAFARARAKYKVQDVDEAVQKHLQIVESRTMADSGRFFDWQGKEVPW
ncbi:unnamed protein product [Cladocopium goreaui]|uniref:C-signal (17-kDa C-factor protein) (p17) (C-factor) (Cell surface-associated intercellular C-signal) n=1 Tax=Cladocopium goreaui TaxID=2562237 RepID=A0A9P1G5W7_9DINO|nr:unnamed protein product [Cladocopium goreaui]